MWLFDRVIAFFAMCWQFLRTWGGSVADDEFLSFAYGSNMLAKRLQARTPSATVHAVGYVEGHVLVFDKKSIDLSGKGNMRKTGDIANRVYGVVFRINK